MRHSACLWFALALLFTALAVGNPFLPCGGKSDGKLAEAAPLRAQPAVLDSGREPAFAMQRSWQRDAGFVLTSGRAADSAIVPASLRASGGQVDLPVCPDAALAPFVVAVEDVAGERVWVLRDGRRMRRNPLLDAGQPLLVPVTSLDK